MENNTWINFWKKHGKETRKSDKQIQVLRTINKKPITSERWEFCLEDIKQKIETKPTDEILDLCCGNGLIAEFLSPYCKSITAVDVSRDLLSGINIRDYLNIVLLHQDIRKLEFPQQTFTKIICYAGIQYLSYQETVLLFEKIKNWVRPGGILFIGDIPDIEKRWTFFNSKEREEVYFNTVKGNKDIVGTWFEKEWFTKLSDFIGFRKCEIIEQHPDMINHYYRFDMKIII